MVDKKSLCHIDICLNQPSGIKNTKTVSKFVKTMPQLRPLMMTIKYYCYYYYFVEKKKKKKKKKFFLNGIFFFFFFLKKKKVFFAYT